MIKNIVFDIGNVLVRFQPDAFAVSKIHIYYRNYLINGNFDLLRHLLK